MDKMALEKIHKYFIIHSHNFIDYSIKHSNEIIDEDEYEKYVYNQILKDIGLSKYINEFGIENATDIFESIMIYGGQRYYIKLVNDIIKEINKNNDNIGKKMFDYFNNVTLEKRIFN